MKKSKKILRFLPVFLSLCAVLVTPAYAAGATESLTTFMNILMDIVRVIGFGIAAYGGVNALISLKSHDSSQRSQGLLSFGIGLMIFFLKDILNAIGVTL